jgi:hypothetical protein
LLIASTNDEKAKVKGETDAGFPHRVEQSILGDVISVEDDLAKMYLTDERRSRLAVQTQLPATTRRQRKRQRRRQQQQAIKLLYELSVAKHLHWSPAKRFTPARLLLAGRRVQG